MPRKRTETVNESLATLAELRERYRGKPQEDRLAVLYLLKEDPSRTLEEVSGTVGCSERTVRRWWSSYKTGGIDELLDIQSGGGGKPARIGEEEVAALAEKLRAEGITDVREVQRWLKEELGLDYSLSGVRYLMRTKLKIDEVDEEEVNGAAYGLNGEAVRNGVRNGEARPSDAVTSSNVVNAPITLSTGLIEFLNAFPTTSDFRDWVEQFRRNLLKLLPDVDRIVVNADLSCDLSDTPKSSRPLEKNIVFRQHMQPGTESGSIVSEPFDVSSMNPTAGRSESMIEFLRSKAFPLAEFHPPRLTDYSLSSGPYLGSMLFFRDRLRAPISEETMNLIEALRPFITFMLSDAIARHQRARPMDIVFKDSLHRMMIDAGLSTQEQRVVFLQLLGCSYKETADLLRVSLNTIRHHLKSIHAKTNTRSQAELFAKYFTPLLSGAGAPESDND